MMHSAPKCFGWKTNIRYVCCCVVIVKYLNVNIVNDKNNMVNEEPITASNTASNIWISQCAWRVGTHGIFWSPPSTVEEEKEVGDEGVVVVVVVVEEEEEEEEVAFLVGVAVRK